MESDLPQPTERSCAKVKLRLKNIVYDQWLDKIVEGAKKWKPTKGMILNVDKRTWIIT